MKLLYFTAIFLIAVGFKTGHLSKELHYCNPVLNFTKNNFSLNNCSDRKNKNHNPVKIIFDTDMDSDVDDVGALAILNAMMDNGEIELLAVMVSSTCPTTAACASAINTYYGRPDLPIGAKKGAGVNRDNGYTGEVAAHFPHKIKSGNDACDAVTLYRKILASMPDNSVTIVSVGYMTNLADLLKSKGDTISSMNGTELVKKKVKEYFCIGGKYPNDLKYEGNGNFEPDGKSIQYVNKYWPGMISFVAGEQYFWDVKTGAKLLKEDMSVNPVAYAYKEFFKRVNWATNYPNHHSADQIGVYVAVKGFNNQYTLTRDDGYFYIYDNGLCEWKTDSVTPLRRISYGLKEPYSKTAKKLANEIETLMLQKPVKKINNK